MFHYLKIILITISLSFTSFVYANTANEQNTDTTQNTTQSDANKAEKKVEPPKEEVDPRLNLKSGDAVYVSDKNIVWARRGPTINHKIVGAKKIGDKLTFLGFSRDMKYAQLKDEQGDDFWMAFDTIQVEPSGYHKYEILENRIAELESILNNYDNELSRRLKIAESKLKRLEKENKGMKSSIASKDAIITDYDEKIRDYSDKLQTKELDMQMRWWTQGGVLVLCGIVIGIILIYLPRPGKKKIRKY